MYLANENFPRPSILLLRKNGLIVESIQENSPGISDDAVMITAVKNNLIILTFDSDYGELIYKYAFDNPPAVVYFREKGPDPLFAGRLLLQAQTTAGLNFYKSFTVIEEKNIRQRFYGI
jgi:predicted nuclease of predicted toxin-antitoxin system